jgi:hypothetical protein
MIAKKSSEAEYSKNGRTPFWIRGAGQAPIAFEEKALSIFQPDTLIPAQYLATFQRRFHLDPERALMFAVIEDAIICFQDNFTATCRRKRSLFHDAEEWIFANDSLYLFSFENICETLGFDPAYIRRGLMRWKEAMQQQSETKENHRKLAS